MPINLGAIGSFLQGAAPNLQAQQQQRMQQAQQAAVVKALQQYASQQQQAQPPGGLPQQGPPGAPAPMATAGAGTQAAPQRPQPNGAMNGMPDPGTMLNLLSKSNLSPDQQYEAWQKYSKEINPLEKYQQNLDLTMTKLDSAQQRLQDQQGFLLKLQGMKGDQSAARDTQKQENVTTKQQLDTLKDQYNQAEGDYRAGLNNPQMKPAAFAELKVARDEAKKAYQDAIGGKTAPAKAASSTGGAAPSGSPPPEAIAALKDDPSTAAQFDEIFGAGAAKKVLGQ